MCPTKHLPFLVTVTVTAAEFQEFFAQFGEITDSVVMFDRETHRSRGFGFVTYEDAVRIMSLFLYNDNKCSCHADCNLTDTLLFRVHLSNLLGRCCSLAEDGPRGGGWRG